MKKQASPIEKPEKQYPGPGPVEEPDAQGLKCLRGEHEPMDTALGVPSTTAQQFYFCRHCRCLYIEKP